MINLDLIKTKYGKPSHTRFAALYANVIVWSVWGIVSGIKGEPLPIPESVSMTLLAITTAAITNTHLSETKKEKENATTQTSIS